MAIPAQRLDNPSPRRIYYPDSDGKPMGETDWHVHLILNAIAVLKNHFVDRPDVYVAGNNFLYYEEGNPKARVSPDTYVVFGVPKRLRNSYMAWKEGGRLPSIVFEYTSRKTRHEDMHKKWSLYEQVLRVPEYIQFDPTGDYLKPRLQGLRLMNGVYTPIPLENDRLYSETLGLFLVIEEELLRFCDGADGHPLLDMQELARLAQDEGLRAELANRRAEAETRRAEAETQRAEAATQRAEAATQQAKIATQRAESEAQRAESEARARAEAEAELVRLRAELEALR